MVLGSSPVAVYIIVYIYIYIYISISFHQYFEYKNLLKRKTFSENFGITLPFTSKGGIQEVFLLFVASIDPPTKKSISYFN